MNTTPEHERLVAAAVEDALRTYPLAPAPRGFSRGVMQRIHLLAEKPRFRLAWVDYAISLFLAGMAGMGVLVWNFMPPQWMAYLHVQILLAEQHLRVISQVVLR